MDHARHGGPNGAQQDGRRADAGEFQRLHLWEIQAVRDALFVAVLFGIVWLGYALRAVTVPLLVALLLAYLFEPLVSAAARRWKLQRPWVVTGLVCSIAVVLVLSIAIAVPVVIGQSVQMLNDLRSGRMQRTLIALREHVPASLVDEYDRTIASMSQFLGVRYRAPKAIPVTTMPATMPGEAEAATAPGDTIDGLDDVGEHADDALLDLTPQHVFSEDEVREMVRVEVESQLSAHAASVQSSTTPSATGVAAPPISSILSISRASAEAIFGLLGTVLQIGFLFFLIPFYLFFFSLYFPQIQHFGLGLIPHRNRKTALPLLRKMDAAVAAFVRGRIVICLIIGVICAVGWSICGVPYAIVLGLITGVFSAVPYLGGIGLPIAIILLWVDQLTLPGSLRMSGWWIVGGPTLVFVIMQLLETYIITPMIAGKATNLDPVTILVAVLAGGSLGGVYGMLLSIPVAACLKILLTDVVMPRVREWVKGQSEDPLPL